MKFLSTFNGEDPVWIIPLDIKQVGIIFIFFACWISQFWLLQLGVLINAKKTFHNKAICSCYHNFEWKWTINYGTLHSFISIEDKKGVLICFSSKAIRIYYESKILSPIDTTKISRQENTSCWMKKTKERMFKNSNFLSNENWKLWESRKHWATSFQQQSLTYFSLVHLLFSPTW